jgi:hypothetical protein
MGSRQSGGKPDPRVLKLNVHASFYMDFFSGLLDMSSEIMREVLWQDRVDPMLLR